MPAKRTLDAFFSKPGPSKHVKSNPLEATATSSASEPIDVDALDAKLARSFSTHTAYPFPIPCLPESLSSLQPAAMPKAMNDKPDLDLLLYEPYLDRKQARQYGEFLRAELPFYRVTYTLKKYGKETVINTPRYTTVFGVDVTSRFDPETGQVLEATTGKPIKVDKYKGKCKPRPIPQCLDVLRRSVEQATGTEYNFCLVNFYATGSDSISYHSDDEHFLEPNPAIASFSFLASRDFLMRHKPPPGKDKGKGKEDETASEAKHGPDKPLKFALQSGTMILMRGPTQRNWLHSIPKRADGGEGRINITFRRGIVPYSTENYYQYNVGLGGVYKWDSSRREMRPWIAQEPPS